VKYDEVLLFVTDAKLYMIKVSNAIQNLYTKIIHITCLAYGLYRLVEKKETNIKTSINLEPVVY